jgi:hypothetical protein
MIDYTKAFATKDNKGFDEGLRNYMLKIYNFMAMALVLTGIMALGTLNFPPLMNLMYNIGPNGEFMGSSVPGIIITFAPLVIAIYFFMGMGRNVGTKSTDVILGLCRFDGYVPVFFRTDIYRTISCTYILYMCSCIWLYEYIWSYYKKGSNFHGLILHYGFDWADYCIPSQYIPAKPCY